MSKRKEALTWSPVEHQLAETCYSEGSLLISVEDQIYQLI